MGFRGLFASSGPKNSRARYPLSVPIASVPIGPAEMPGSARLRVTRGLSLGIETRVPLYKRSAANLLSFDSVA